MTTSNGVARLPLPTPHHPYEKATKVGETMVVVVVKGRAKICAWLSPDAVLSFIPFSFPVRTNSFFSSLPV